MARYEQITPQVVAAIPGGGWWAEWKQEDGTVTDSPILCWNVWDDGSVKPMATDATGFVDECNESNLERIYFKGQE